MSGNLSGILKDPWISRNCVRVLFSPNRKYPSKLPALLWENIKKGNNQSHTVINWPNTQIGFYFYRVAENECLLLGYRMEYITQWLSNIFSLIELSGQSSVSSVP
jgi:hypothetical protein